MKYVSLIFYVRIGAIELFTIYLVCKKLFVLVTDCKCSMSMEQPQPPPLYCYQH